MDRLVPPDTGDNAELAGPVSYLLDERQCLALLASACLGRVGVSIGALPAIFPVSYRVVDGSVFFYAGDPAQPRESLRDTVVAFQVDGTHPSSRSRWSVQAVGVARLCDAQDARVADGVGLHPLLPVQEPALVALRPERLTGWQLGGGYSGS